MEYQRQGDDQNDHNAHDKNAIRRANFRGGSCIWGGGGLLKGHCTCIFRKSSRWVEVRQHKQNGEHDNQESDNTEDMFCFHRVFIINGIAPPKIGDVERVLVIKVNAIEGITQGRI